MKKSIKKWTDEEKNYILKNYSNTRNQDLCDMFDVSYGQIINLAKKLKLKKTKEYKSRMIAKRNKMVGRDLNYEVLKDIALKFKTKSEFCFNDSSAYSSANRMGVMSEITQHMIKQSFSIPQLICQSIFNYLLKDECLYDTRKIIKPYELDLFYEKLNFSVEYNGKGWHSDDDNTKRKIEMCEDKNIFLLVIKERNRRYEEDIKSQIIENLNKINEKTNFNITEGDVNGYIIDNSIFDNILDEEYIKKVVGEYIYFKDFRKDNLLLYNKIIKLGKIDFYTKHLIRERVEWSDEYLKETISKYEYLGDLIENDKGCYLHIKRNNKEYLLKDLKYKKDDMVWSDDEIKEIVYKYEYYYDFKQKEGSCYGFIQRNKKEYMLHVLKKKQITWTEDMAKEIINRYSIYNDFKQNEPKCHSYLKVQNKTHLMKHLDGKQIVWTEDIAKEIINKYSSYNDFRKKETNCYCYITRKNKYHLLEHLDGKQITWTEDMAKEIINKYSIYNDFMKNEHKCYSYLTRIRKKYLLDCLKQKQN